jgi:thiamine-phosphate pyrophosphorylase
MAKRPHEPARPRVQLLLTVEPGQGGEALLAAALEAAPISAVILKPAPGHGLSAPEVKTLIARGQKAGAAVLIADDAQLARVVRADGVYLTWQGPRGKGGLEQDFEAESELDDPAHERALDAQIARVDEARDIVGGQAIVGVEVADTRDSAMRLGETSVDFVAFGQPDAGVRRAFVTWWAEVFEVPCVALDAYVEDGDEMTAALLAHAGAEFVEIVARAGSRPDDIKAGVAAVADAVGAIDG